MRDNVLRIGVGGPVGSGKTSLIEALCKRMRNRYHIAVVTNDIYTQEDAQILVRSQSARGRAHHRRGDRRLPAHGHSRGRLDESRSHRSD